MRPLHNILKLFMPFTATLIFLLLSLYVIFMHQIGQDSFSIILIEFNPILSFISDSDMGLTLLNSGKEIPTNTVAGSISIYWYIGSVLTFLLYGAVIDFIRYTKRHPKLSHK